MVAKKFSKVSRYFLHLGTQCIRKVHRPYNAQLHICIQAALCTRTNAMHWGGIIYWQPMDYDCFKEVRAQEVGEAYLGKF